MQVVQLCNGATLKEKNIIFLYYILRKATGRLDSRMWHQQIVHLLIRRGRFSRVGCTGIGWLATLPPFGWRSKTKKQTDKQKPK